MYLHERAHTSFEIVVNTTISKMGLRPTPLFIFEK